MIYFRLAWTPNGVFSKQRLLRSHFNLAKLLHWCHNHIAIQQMKQKKREKEIQIVGKSNIRVFFSAHAERISMSEPPSGVFSGLSFMFLGSSEVFFLLEQDLRRHDLREACKPILVPPWSRPTFSPPAPSLKLPVHVCKKKKSLR